MCFFLSASKAKCTFEDLIAIRAQITCYSTKPNRAIYHCIVKLKIVNKVNSFPHPLCQKSKDIKFEEAIASGGESCWAIIPVWNPTISIFPTRKNESSLCQHLWDDYASTMNISNSKDHCKSNHFGFNPQPTAIPSKNRSLSKHGLQHKVKNFMLQQNGKKNHRCDFVISSQKWLLFFRDSCKVEKEMALALFWLCIATLFTKLVLL